MCFDNHDLCGLLEESTHGNPLSILVGIFTKTSGRLKTGSTGFKRFSDDLFEILGFQLNLCLLI